MCVESLSILTPEVDLNKHSHAIERKRKRKRRKSKTGLEAKGGVRENAANDVSLDCTTREKGKTPAKEANQQQNMHEQREKKKGGPAKAGIEFSKKGVLCPHALWNPKIRGREPFLGGGVDEKKGPRPPFFDFRPSASQDEPGREMWRKFVR